MANDVTSKVIFGLDPSEFRRGIQQVDAKLKQTSDLFNNLGKAIGATFAVGIIQNFAKEAMVLGDQLTKVSQGFDRFGGEANLEQLRQSTRGLVSDLELMKSATKAGTFGIGIGEMGQLLNFATRRAQETGQEVDYLVNSIVTGIGRKSPLILDNLGISAVQLREKLNGVNVEAASIGEVSRAVGQIASEQLRLMGESADTAADKLQRVNTIWANFKAETGQFISRTGLAIAEIFGQLVTGQSLIGALTPSTSVGASEPNRPAGPASLNFGNFSEQTLANMRAQLAAFNAELENVAIGSARFKELRTQIDALQSSIKKLTEPVFSPPTLEKITLAKSEMGSFGTVSLRAGEVLRSSTIPSMQDTGQAARDIVTSLERYNAEMALLNQVGAEFGYIFTSSFNAAMVNGTSFFEEMKNALKAYITQMLVAVGVTAALAAVMSSILPGLSFGKAFKGISGGTGLGGIFGEGGIIELVGTLRGFDLQMTSNRTNNFLRSGN